MEAVVVGERAHAVRTTKALAVVLGAAVTVALSLASARADAHTVGLSTGEYTAKGDGVGVKLSFARGEVAGLVPGLDANRDGHVTAFEIDAAKRELESRVLGRIEVRAGGAACTPLLTGAALTDQDGLSIDGRYDCQEKGAMVLVNVALLDDLAEGHRHVARGVGATTADEVLSRGHVSFAVTPAGAAAAAGATSAGAQGAARGAEGGATAASPRARSAWSFFALGIEHILTGYDHLVFLVGLVLLRTRLRDLFTVITAFTVAHSLTLAVAALGIFAPSPKFVEPAIALSIAYVGIENFVVKDGSKRWRITFPFGLIHGFGFAGALQGVSLPRAQVPVALVSFNLGVEAGQLFAMGLVLPMIWLVRQQAWFEPKGVRVLSGAVAAAGCVWFVARVVGAGW